MSLLDVVESSEVKVLQDFNIYTDRVLASQHPDIVVIEEYQKVVLIVDVTVLYDHNVTMKEAEKI